jgi:hypothetical protein
MFLNIFSFTKSCSWKKIFFENSNNFLTNNLISVKAAKVTMVFKFVNPFYGQSQPYWTGAVTIYTYLQTLTRPRTSMAVGFGNFNINEPAVLIE